MLQDLNELETVLLDMDGTILDLHYDNFFWVKEVPRIYAEERGMPEQEAIDFLTPIFRSHEGTLNWYSVDFWSDLLGFDVMHHKSQVAHKIAWLPNAEAFLKACQRDVPDTRLVTNGHRKVLELKVAKTGLDQYFSEMICSHELGAAKESQDFWHRLMMLREFDPATTLFIDDNEAVLDSAKKFGIEHVYSVAMPDTVTPRTSTSKYPMLTDYPSIA